METVAFDSIGFHAALILNRLRNEQRIADDKGAERASDRTDEDQTETQGDAVTRQGRKRRAAL